MSTPCPGPDLLRAEIMRQGLSVSAAARAIGRPKPRVLSWLNRQNLPDADGQARIAVWTDGRVPVSAWQSDDTAADLAKLERPARKARRPTPQFLAS